MLQHSFLKLRRWWLFAVGAIAIVAASAIATPMVAQNASYSTYNLPESLYGLTTDPAGNIWTTAAGNLYRLNPSTNQLTNYSHAVAFGTSYGAASDSSGNIWFTNLVGGQCRINKFDPTTADITSWTWGTSNCGQYGVGVDSTGKVWFGEQNHVARLDTSTNTITAWLLSTTPTDIAVDSQDRVWVLEAGTNTVGLLDPTSNNLDEWPAPGTSVGGGPRTISVDSSDRAWFAARSVFIDPETVNTIVRLTDTTNDMTQYVCPPGLCTTPSSVAAEDPSGIVWFTEEQEGSPYVQRLDPAANPPEFTRWYVPTGEPANCQYPEQIVSDQSNGAWFIFFGRGYRSGYNCYYSPSKRPYLHQLQPF